MAKFWLIVQWPIGMSLSVLFGAAAGAIEWGMDSQREWRTRWREAGRG